MQHILSAMLSYFSGVNWDKTTNKEIFFYENKNICVLILKTAFKLYQGQ